MASQAERTLTGQKSLLEYLPVTLLHKLNHGFFSWLLTLACGALFPLAFAPFNTRYSVFAWLIFFPLAIFFYQLIHSPTSKQAFFRGWLFGIGLFGVGVSWLYVAIHDFGAAHWLLAGLFTGLFIVFLALFYALFGWLVVRLKNLHLIADSLFIVVYIPLIWVFMEWVRTWFLTGFPWLLAGYPMIATPLSGFAPVIGIYGLSLLVVLLSALLAVQWRFYISLMLAVGIFISAFVVADISWTQAVDQPLKVAMVQGNVNQSVKWSREQLEKTKRHYVNLSQPLWQDNDLIVWPENAIPAFYHTLQNSFYRRLSQQANNTNTELVLGLPVYDEKTEQYYNALTNLGGQQGFYYKSHLVPFGEYVPLAGMLRSLLHFFNMPMSGFSAGNKEQDLVIIKNNPAAITICYEDVFAADIISNIPDAKFMINLSNNGWYGDSFAPHQHFEMARMRALETGRELIRSTTSGITALVDHKGLVKVRGPQFKTTVVSGSIQPRQGVTPYVYWGNTPILALLILAALYLVYLKKRVS